MLSTSRTTQTIGSTNSLRSTRSGFLGGLFSREPGDSIDKAKSIGTLSRSRSYSKSGEVSKKDPDFFSFKVDGTTSITARLKNENKDKSPIAMTILDRSGESVSDNGRFLFRNIQPGGTKQITASLSSGTYYVRLTSAKGKKQDYDFDLSASSSIGSGGSGGSGSNLGDVENLGVLRSGRTYRESGNVGGDSNIDSYRFTIDRTSRVFADLSNNGNDDIAFRLVNNSGETVRRSNGNLLFANVRPDDDDRILASTLGAGTYSFVITSSGGRSEDYSLGVNQSDVTPI
jgi:hypothetical protein